MIKSNERPLAARARTVALALLLSFMLIPVCAYVAGSLVVGDYEGPSGLLGYLIAIYGDALNGRWLAWTLILTPLLILAIWAIVALVLRRIRELDSREE
ncbi:MAG: hypothetical protein ACE5G3_12970 [Gammaproteobacteria bacterium]